MIRKNVLGDYVDAEGEVIYPTSGEIHTPNAPCVEGTRTVPEILETAAATYRERNAIYGDNYKNTGAVMRALFPDGVKLVTADDFNRWCLFELVIVKLTRFTNSGLTHIDSIHDAAVYAAMLESLTNTTKLESPK